MDVEQPEFGYWAVTTRGLEEIARAEVLELDPAPLAVVAGYRRVAFSSSVDPAMLLELRTVDDLFVDLATWEELERPRATLRRLGDLSMELDLREAAAHCRMIRELGAPPAFSVTVNFVGRRNYSTDEIKVAVASGIETTHRWQYCESDSDADLNIRIFIEHERAYVGARLAAAPLHERSYKVMTIPGSLKPTVAAAMVRMGAFSAGSRVVDPLCGAGTIPIEAALSGLDALGGDRNPDALAAARANGAAAGVSARFESWDARALPLPDGRIDGVVCNLPWGRQVDVEEQIEPFYADCLREIARVIGDGGRAILLTSLTPLLHAAAAGAGLRVETETEISLSGQTPVISVLRKARKDGA